jgi:hypothetical protein
MRTCRQCGCTDTLACPGGCFWIGLDLCSTCYQKLKEDLTTDKPSIAKELIKLLKTSGINSKQLTIEVLENLLIYEV